MKIRDTGRLFVLFHRLIDRPLLLSSLALLLSFEYTPLFEISLYISRVGKWFGS